MADVPCFPLRTRYPSCVHRSSKSRVPLTNCPVPGTRESYIFYRPPFRPQICDSRGGGLTFCKCQTSGDGDSSENRTGHLGWGNRKRSLTNGSIPVDFLVPLCRLIYNKVAMLLPTGPGVQSASVNRLSKQAFPYWAFVRCRRLYKEKENIGL